MGSRTKYRKCDAYPSANSYSLPTLIGPRIPTRQASNAYSMTARRNVGSFDQDLANTPGAARYNLTVTRNAKHYNLDIKWLIRITSKNSRPNIRCWHVVLCLATRQGNRVLVLIIQSTSPSTNSPSLIIRWEYDIPNI